MTQDYTGQIVWIIGASSGIGAALSRELAARGATLALSARRMEALETLAHSLGTQHKAYAVDVTDAERVIRTAQAIRACHGRIDRVVFLAASYTPMTLSQLDIAATRQVIDVNLTGAFYVTHAALAVFSEQKHGQLALCGSVAGFTGLPHGQPYCATKAGIISLAESLRAELPPEIDIKIINPGFVRTELTDKNDFHMPMIINAEVAATRIADGLRQTGFEIHFPRRFTLLVKLLRLLPYWLALKITKKLTPH